MKKKDRLRTFTIECGLTEVKADGEGKCKLVVECSGKQVRIINMTRYDVSWMADKMWKWLREDKKRVLEQFEYVERQMRGE